MAVKMTERAAQEFKAACSSRSLPVESTMLRLDAERAEGSEKLHISLRFDDDSPADDDVVEETDGALLVVNKGLSEALGEARLDYKDDRSGFTLERVT